MSGMTSTTKFSGALLLSLITGLLAAVLVLAACDFTITPEDIKRTLEQAPCAEDEPCWDCETMGNRICGPNAQRP